MDSGSALRVEKTTTHEAGNQKNLCSGHQCPAPRSRWLSRPFKQHRLVIPMTVLEELDHIKDRRDKTVSREARIAIQID